MATIETGTAILARARIIAQDNGTNFAVGASDALILLNDVLVTLNNNGATKPKWVGASVSGLTFAAGESSHVSTFLSTDDIITEVESFHQAAASTFAAPASPAIERITVQEMLDMLNYDGDHALTGSATQWTHVAMEKAQSDTSGADTAFIEQLRVWAFPVIGQARSIHMRVPVPVTISAITKTPNLDNVDTRIASQILAYKIAKLKKETSQAFLDNILRDIPQEYRDPDYGGGVRKAQLQDGIRQVDY
jgi:hypothetical protein